MQSYQRELEKEIEKIFSKFINDVSNKYNVSQHELTLLWKGEKIEKKENDFSKLNKKELENKCKELGLSTKGKKAELLKRIENRNENIVEKIKTSITNIVIKKNKFGNYEHEPTKMVFNKATKTVVGKQMENGNIVELTTEDINICNEYKFKYKLPEKIENVLSDDEDFDDFEAETDSDESDHDN